MAMYQEFIERGILLRNAATITLEVRPEQIAPGVEIHPGCQISGETTSIGPNCRIGTEGPVRLEDCQLGRNVTFASGFAKQTTLLDGVTVGANAHIRPGSLLEEQASTAHCVGLKQTLMMPFATLGSLINFCDCLLAGGTSRSNHSEVGSSFVHFNFTPRGDKATPSLFGDVPSGILLDQAPIFLGGQCGVVGPVRVAYGCIQAAGSVLRRDASKPNTLLTPGNPLKGQETPNFDPRAYGNISRIVRNNCIYMGNLHALHAWYKTVRSQWLAADSYSKACLQGATERLQQMVAERTKQLGRMAEKVAQSPTTHPSHEKFKAFLATCDLSLLETTPAVPDILQQHIESNRQSDYITCIQSLSENGKAQTRAWLQSMVDQIQTQWEQAANE